MSKRVSSCYSDSIMSVSGLYRLEKVDKQSYSVRTIDANSIEVH